MKFNNSKQILFYALITFISLIIAGIVGAIIRLINVPAIVITLIIIGGLSYYKRIGWWQNLISSLFKIKSEKESLNLSLKSLVIISKRRRLC